MKSTLREFLLIILTCCILSEIVYEPLKSYDKKQIKLASTTPGVLEENFEFQCKKDGDNIIRMIPSIEATTLKDKISITIHEGKSIEKDPSSVLIWDFSTITTEKDEYIFKSTAITSCFVKIKLLNEVNNAELTLHMFNELDPQELIKEMELETFILYSTRKAYFSMTKPKYFYLDFTVTSAFNLAIKLFKKDDMVPLHIEISKIGSNSSFKSKGDPLVDNFEYILEITDTSSIASRDTEPLFGVVFFEEKYEVFPVSLKDRPLNFKGTDAIFSYVVLENDSTDKDLFLSFNVQDTNDQIAIKSFFVELPEPVENNNVYDAIDKATFNDEKVVELSKSQKNLYFRFPLSTPQAGMKTIKVFLINYTPILKESSLTFSYTASISWEVDTVKPINTFSHELQKGKSVLINIKTTNGFPKKAYLIGSTMEIGKIFEGSIVKTGNIIQEGKVINQLYIFTPGQTKDITIEYCNTSNEALTIFIQIEDLEKPDIIEMDYFKTNHIKTFDNTQTGDANQWYMIDFEEIDTQNKETSWLALERLFGEMKVEYKSEININHKEPVSLLSMTGSTTVKQLKELKPKISIVKVSAIKDQYARIAMSFKTSPKTVTIKKYEQTTIVASTKTLISIPEGVWKKEGDEITNLEIRIIGYQTPEDEKEDIIIKYDTNTKKISNYGILPIKKLENHEITIESPKNVLIKISSSKAEYYTQLSYDAIKETETLPIKTRRIMVKLEDPRVKYYSIAFNKRIQKPFFTGMNRGFDGFLSKPIDLEKYGSPKGAKTTILNPYFLNSNELLPKEFFYMSYEFAKEDLKDLKIIITKSYYSDLGETILNFNKILYMKPAEYKYKKFELQYNHSAELNNILLLFSFNKLPLLGSKIHFDNVNKKDVEIITFEKIKQYVELKSRELVVYSIRLELLGDPELALSFRYMNDADLKELPTLYILPQKFIFNDKNKLSWNSYSTQDTLYFIFIEKNIATNLNEEVSVFETEKEMYQNRDKSILIPFNDKEYFIPKDLFDDGEYKINILATNGNFILLYFGYEQQIVTIKHNDYKYETITSFEDIPIDLSTKDNERKFKFTIEREGDLRGDLIIKLSSVTDLTNKINIIVNFKRPFEDDEPFSKPDWTINYETRKDEYVYKTNFLGPPITCYVKISLVPEVSSANFNFKMFSELDYYQIKINTPINVLKAYSKKEIRFNMPNLDKYNYYEFTIDSLADLTFELLQISPEFAIVLPIEIQKTDGKSEYKFQSKGDVSDSNNRYVLIIYISPTSPSLIEPLLTITGTQKRY